MGAISDEHYRFHTKSASFVGPTFIELEENMVKHDKNWWWHDNRFREAFWGLSLRSTFQKKLIKYMYERRALFYWMV